ncbi:hypothetical protein BH11PLA1_BH11PLA1_07540 [soil metagenome]
MPRDANIHRHDDRTRIQHMLTAARDSQLLIAGRTLEDLHTGMPLQRALINALEVLGEAASKVSDAGKTRIPSLE